MRYAARRCAARRSCAIDAHAQVDAAADALQRALLSLAAAIERRCARAQLGAAAAHAAVEALRRAWARSARAARGGAVQVVAVRFAAAAAVGTHGGSLAAARVCLPPGGVRRAARPAECNAKGTVGGTPEHLGTRRCTPAALKRRCGAAV